MNKKQLSILITCAAVFLGFILFTSPYHLPLLLVVLPGVAFIVMVHTALSILVRKFATKPATARMTVNVLTAVLAVAAVLISVGQLTFRDFSLLLALALIGVFYVSRMLDR